MSRTAVNDVAKWKLRGPVHTLTTELADWDRNLDAWAAPRHRSVVTFRPDGSFSESEHHNPDGSVAVTKHVYDGDGQLTEAQFWTGDALTGRVLYHYDDQGRPIRAVDVAPDGTRRDAEAYSYAEDGRKTKVQFLSHWPTAVAMSCAIEGTETFYPVSGAATLTIRHDARDQPEEALMHDAGHGLLRRITFSRDDEGRLLSEDMQLCGETPFPEMQATLDGVPPDERAEFGELIEKVFGPDMTFSSTTYDYDGKGRVAESRRRMGALSESLSIFRYDTFDNLIEETVENHSRGMDMDPNRDLHTTDERSRTQHTRFDYEYDEQGNWTERVVSVRSDPGVGFVRSNIERRRITYHAG